MQTNDSPQQIYSEISSRISSLESLMGEDLRNEMTSLKIAIKENPSACMLLLPDEIGTMVSALRKVVGIAIATASAKIKKSPAEKKATTKKMTAEELAAALDDEDF